VSCFQLSTSDAAIEYGNWAGLSEFFLQGKANLSGDAKVAFSEIISSHLQLAVKIFLSAPQKKLIGHRPAAILLSVFIINPKNNVSEPQHNAAGTCVSFAKYRFVVCA
jgi:hypothetical protein